MSDRLTPTPPASVLDRARSALRARMAKDALRLVLENVIAYAADLEAEREKLVRWHLEDGKALDRLQRKVASLKEQQERDDAEYAQAIGERNQSRSMLREACDQIAALESDLGDAMARAAELTCDRDALQKRLHDAAMAKVWTNEDRKKFVFVEDLAPALLGINSEEVAR